MSRPKLVRKFDKLFNVAMADVVADIDRSLDDIKERYGQNMPIAIVEEFDRRMSQNMHAKMAQLSEFAQTLTSDPAARYILNQMFDDLQAHINMVITEGRKNYMPK